MNDLRAQIRALIAEINAELRQPLDALDDEEKRYFQGIRMGKGQVVYQLEAILGTPGYTRRVTPPDDQPP